MSIFGSTARFALQVELLESARKFVVVHICLWADGMRIGDCAQPVLLSPIADFFRGTIRVQDRCVDPEHVDLSPEQILGVVLDVLFSDARGKQDTTWRRRMERYRGLCICPNGCEAFDGEAAVLVARDGSESFIWRDFTDKRVREQRLAPGEYGAVVRLFLSWADPLTGYVPSREHFAGKTFVIVGSFSRPQQEIAGIIRRFGGRVDQKVSARTSYVVEGQVPSKVPKAIAEARILGVRVLSEAQFESLLPSPTNEPKPF